MSSNREEKLLKSEGKKVSILHTDLNLLNLETKKYKNNERENEM